VIIKLNKMGTCAFKQDGIDETNQISKSSFYFHYVIGKGGFGKVIIINKGLEGTKYKY